MRRRAARKPLVAIALALAAFALPAHATPGAVFIVRHGEKQSESNEKEVPLSEAGRARAVRLAAMLKDARIVAIYSTDTVRTLSTAEPLAAAAKITPQIYEAAGADAAGNLAARISKEHPAENVLVVGHSNTVGPLVAALGCAEEVRIAPQEYDGLWIVMPASAAGTSRTPGTLRKEPATLLRLRN